MEQTKGTVINVQAVYDEDKLKQMANNTAKVSYQIMSTWPGRSDFLMNVKALAMGFLAALDERDEARARYRVLEKEHLSAAASREAHRVNAENSQAAEKRALAERDDARSDHAWMKREIDHMRETLTPLFQNGRKHHHFARPGEDLIDAVPRLVTAFEEQSDELAALLDRADKLESFKSYVHKRLDQMGVPANPEPAVHAIAGCRVGDRLDWLAEQLPLQTSPVERRRIDRLEQANDRLKTCMHATRMAISGLLDSLNQETHGKT